MKKKMYFWIDKVNKLDKRYKYFIILIFLFLLVVIIPVRKNSFHEITKRSNLEKICKFATVQAIYHNVGSYNDPAKGFAKDIIKTGYKKYWIEYDATVNLGIDCSKIKIKKSFLSNKINVGLPKIEIIGEPLPIKDTMIEEYETGMFTSIDAETDKIFAYNKVKENMIKNVSEDSELIKFANKRTRDLIENYIIKIGLSNNKNYKVDFYEIK